MNRSNRGPLLQLVACALAGLCAFATGCFSGPSGGWTPSSWSSDDLADDRQFQDEVLKSGFPKAASVGLGDARQSK